MHKLQELVFPKDEIKAPEDMYFRRVGETAEACLVDKGVMIPQGETVSFDTFFNGFSVKPWMDNCSFENLSLAIAGKGSVTVRIGIHHPNAEQQWLDECLLELAETPSDISLPSWRTVTDGILFLAISAITDAEISGGYYFTRDNPTSEVKLGIVITHFNRKHYVLPAMKRISNELLADPDIKGRVDLIVVDNSQNIEPPETAKATVIPNKNLGGSGGFTRGLLHLKDSGFSHCLVRHQRP